MIKKIAVILLISISIISSAFSSEFFLERDGWCINYEIPFHVYDLNEWNNREDIIDDKDKNFSKLSFNIKIYNGPFEDEKDILFEKTFTDAFMPSFTQTITKEGFYLIKIKGNKGNYTQYEEKLEIFECDRPEKKEKLLEESKKDQSFNFPNYQINLEIKKTNINNSNQIKIKNENIESLNIDENLKKNSVIYSINSNSSIFDSMILSFMKESGKENFKLYKFDYNSKQIKEIKIQEKENQITAEVFEFGTYILYSEDIIQEEEKEINNEKVIKEEIVEKRPVENLEVNESKLSNYYIYIIIGIILVIILLFAPKLFSIKNDKSLYHYNRDQQTNIHHSDSDEIYNKAKKYIQTYKSQYSKEALMTALKSSGVTEEIIEKVFSEEY